MATDDYRVALTSADSQLRTYHTPVSLPNTRSCCHAFVYSTSNQDLHLRCSAICSWPHPSWRCCPIRPKNKCSCASKSHKLLSTASSTKVRTNTEPTLEAETDELRATDHRPASSLVSWREVVAGNSCISSTIRLATVAKLLPPNGRVHNFH